MDSTTDTVPDSQARPRTVVRPHKHKSLNSCHNPKLWLFLFHDNCTIKTLIFTNNVLLSRADVQKTTQSLTAYPVIIERTGSFRFHQEGIDKDAKPVANWLPGNFRVSECQSWTYTTQIMKDICQYLDSNTKFKVNSRNCTKHIENVKLSLTFV